MDLIMLFDKKMESNSKLNIAQTCLIGLGFLSCSLAWGMYNFYLPRILAGYSTELGILRVGYFTGDNRLLYANLVMVLDNVFAIFIQPLFGGFSDKLKSKYGRRTPFLIIGIPVASVCLFISPFVTKMNVYILMFVSLMFIVVIFNLAMAIYRAPVVALMPDLTPSEHRSMANVIINLMGGVGGAVGWLIPVVMGKVGFIKANIIEYATFETQDFFALDAGVFWTTGLFLVVVLVLFMRFVHEEPTGTSFWKLDKNTRKDTKHVSVLSELKLIFTHKDKSSAFMFLTLFFWSASSDAFSTNLSLWGPEYALLDDTALMIMNVFMGVSVAVLGYIGAKLSQKKGRLWTIKIGIILMSVSYLGIIIFQEMRRSGLDLLGFLGISLSVGFNSCGGALIGIAAITVTWQLAPKERLGAYTGLYYVFKQTGSVLAPILIGGILSAFTPALGSTKVWLLLLPFCMLLSIIASIMFHYVKKGEVGDSLTDDEVEKLKEELRVDD
jgi:maltose/moltooligosaccharide transporter